MGKHAYCIIAHRDAYTLNKLIECIDDVRNDIFVLIDKKAKIKYSDISQPINSQLITPPHFQGVNIYWGHISLVDAELRVLKMAYDYGHYDYYHLISGQDLPLHSQDYIHNFFDNVNNGTLFLGYTYFETVDVALTAKMEHYIPFIKYYKHGNPILRRITKKLRNLAMDIQTQLNFKRYNIADFKKGTEWCSITEDFVRSLLHDKSSILKKYRGVFCPDEIYKHTMVYNTPFRHLLYNAKDEFTGCMREIDWVRGNPYTYTIADLHTLLNSDKIFARKFDSDVDKTLIDTICQTITNK